MPKIDLIQNNVSKILSKQNLTNKNETQTTKFSDTLKDLIQQVNENHNDSAKSIENFVAGKEGNLHNVMAAMEEARLSFQLMMEIRNKVLESFNELMRTPV